MHGFKIITNLEPDNPLLQMPRKYTPYKVIDRNTEEKTYRRNWAFQDPRCGPSYRDFVSQ